MSDQGSTTQQTTLRQLQAVPSVNSKIGFGDSASFELIQRVANAFSNSTLVPEQYRKNPANCIIALNMAQRLNADPLLIMQALYVVHGRPAWSSQFLIASLNATGRFSPIRYRWQGTEGKDDWGCRAWAKEKDTGEEIVGPLVTIALAKKEGWYAKNGSKWQSLPELMLCYRAAAFLVRTHAPEISMGIMTAEEVDDIVPMDKGPDGVHTASVESLRAEVAERKADPIQVTLEELDANEVIGARSIQVKTVEEIPQAKKGDKKLWLMVDQDGVAYRVEDEKFVTPLTAAGAFDVAVSVSWQTDVDGERTVTSVHGQEQK